jgi:trehalose-phosphatase
MLDIPSKTIIADFLDRLSAAGRSVLMLDYDGTLAPFQIKRDQAYPYPGVISILNDIIRCGNTKVIVISGRPVYEVKTLLRPLDNLEIWGTHGVEHMLEDGTCQSIKLGPETATHLAQVEQWLHSAGLSSLAEIKPGGIAIHWRGMSDSEINRVQAHAQKGWTTIAQQSGLKLLSFEGGLELRTAHPDKGDAVFAIMRDLAPTTQIAYLGDDLTDEDAFCALDNRGLSVLVRTEYRKTRAKAWLKPPHEMISFLEQWLRRVSLN